MPYPLTGLNNNLKTKVEQINQLRCNLFIKYHICPHMILISVKKHKQRHHKINTIAEYYNEYQR